jgi:fatty-acyl-CoA synthase
VQKAPPTSPRIPTVLDRAVFTVVDALAAAAGETRAGHTFLRADGTSRSLSFAALNLEARRVGAGLRALGLGAGDRVALVIPDPETFVVTFLGAMTAGLVPVPMYPPPSLSKLDAYASTLEHVLGAAGAALLIAPHSQLEMLQDVLRAESPNLRTVDAEAIPRAEPIDFTPAPDDIALLQFTSGSTSAPKGVTITHAQLAANARAIIVDGLKAEGGRDIGVSWLPLYHDMGLIGFVVAPLLTRVPVVFIPTSTFVRRPTVWLKTIHEHRGTITFAPNFAFALATRAIQERHMEGWDLSCLRVAGCGAEPISADVMRAFSEKFGHVGLAKNAIMPAYGMAEATLAVTFGELDHPLRIDRVCASALKQGLAEPKPHPEPHGLHSVPPLDAIELVACGKPLQGFAVEVRDEAGIVVADRVVGEVFVRGPSIAEGYYNQPETTRATFVDGWLRTGDLGYIADGALFVSGRKKDLIIIHGRNYLPQDIESIVGGHDGVDGIRFGQVVAFGRAHPLTGAEALVIVAETARPITEHDTIRGAIKARVHESVGLVVDETVFIQRGTLPKTSSGKVRRSETKARLELGTLDLAGAANTTGANGAVDDDVA